MTTLLNKPFTTTHVVSEHDTALAAGSGELQVLATPRLIAWLENAAMLAVAEGMQSEQTTVGGEMSMRHLRPTLVGQIVTTTATLIAVEGSKLTFSIEAFEGEKKIAEGSHLRFIVDKAKFMAKAMGENKKAEDK